MQPAARQPECFVAAYIKSADSSTQWVAAMGLPPAPSGTPCFSADSPKRSYSPLRSAAVSQSGGLWQGFQGLVDWPCSRSSAQSWQCLGAANPKLVLKGWTEGMVGRSQQVWRALSRPQTRPAAPSLHQHWRLGLPAKCVLHARARQHPHVFKAAAWACHLEAAAHRLKAQCNNTHGC